MQKDEFLKVAHNGSQISIVENMLFIGSSDEESEKEDTLFEFRNDQLLINGWEMTPAMVSIIKQYIDK